MRRLLVALPAALAGLILASTPATAGEPAPPADEGRPDEDALFGGDADTTPEPAPGEAADPKPAGRSEGATPESKREDDLFGAEPPTAGAGREALLADPLSLGGQLYLRLMTQVSDRGALGDQALSMPNLLDVYLDARPEERVRGFFSGRLFYDPTVTAGATDSLGQPRDRERVLVDQLWIKTDIARTVFLTVGQERIKWGASRLWNPTDFVNARRRDPLAVFDERTGVPMLKVDIPAETWNFYLIGLLGGATELDQPGFAFRVEKAFSASEVSVSGVFGDGRKTSFGADLSTALGPFDLTAEVSLTDERDTPEWSGTLDFDTLSVPTSTPHDAWMARASVGLQYAFKPNDEDVQYIGLEYFYNPLGVSDPALYPWLLLQGQLEPFYLGQHYAGLVWAVPSPGQWDEASFTFSTLANLSDESVVSRLDFAVTLHTRLRLEAYAQVHYGHRGGELRFALDVPALPAIPGLLDEPVEAFSVPAPRLALGLNLRVSL